MGMCKPSGGIQKVIGHLGDLDPTGPSNTRSDLYDENDKLLQQRWYGPDGKAEWDRDWSHGGNHEFPHDHSWRWDIDEDHPPRPPYIGPNGEKTNTSFC